MSERKVLNKYYPPDFDPSKIPRMKLSRNRQYTVRLMAPFNMRCATCGEYIYKGKKFNARKEDVENEDYLGIRIYRFYIKCTRCLQEISFKTDPKNTDYEIEAGATRNFMALKLAEEQAKREEDELKEEEANNPMKLLENRTEQSRNEIALLESLEELKDLNRRQATVDYDSMLMQYAGESAEDRRKREEREDEEFIKSVKFKSGSNTQHKRIISEEIIEDFHEEVSSTKKIKIEPEFKENGNASFDSKALDASQSKTLTASASKTIVNNTIPSVKSSKDLVWNKSVGAMSRKNALAGLVKVKSKISETVTSTGGIRAEAQSSSSSSMSLNKTESVTIQESNKKVDDVTSTVSSSTGAVTSGGLSLLSGYSDSDSNNDSD